MDVVLVGGGRVVLQNAGHPIHVDAASGNVGGHQYVHIALAERSQGLLALALAAVTVNGLGANAGLVQLFRQTLGTVAGPTEDDGRPASLHNGGGHLDALSVGHGPEAMGDLALHLERCRLVMYRVRLVIADEHVDIAVEGGGEEHRLAFLVGEVEQATDFREEPHVGHAVGFVDHHDAHVVEAQRAALEKVFEATGGGHHDFDALGQGPHLAVHAGTAVHRQHLGFGAPAQGHELVLYLRRQFPGGYQHECFGAAGGRLFNSGQQRKAEGDGLAGAGRGLSAHVATGEGIGKGGGLYRERIGDTEDV